MIGERLAELRKDKGLRQEDLAKELGLSYTTISSYEREISEPNHEMLIKLAKHFNVSIDYLLGLKRERVSYQLDDNVIVLPPEFSEENKEKVKSYIEFLAKGEE